jgi:hypothetical protein
MPKKQWNFLINEQEITLITTSQVGICSKCQQEKELRLICEKKLLNNDLPTWEITKFCQSCALTNLYELEENNYQMENKQAIIKKIRSELNKHE